MKTAHTTKRRDRNHLKVGGYWRCLSCFYQTKRYYNLTRHEARIHTPLKRELQCCHMFFKTKGELYNHYTNSHALLRKNRSFRRKYMVARGETREDTKDAESSKKTVSLTNDYTEFVRAPYSLRPKPRETRNLANNGRGYEESELSEYTSGSESKLSEFPAGSEIINSESTSDSEIGFDVERIEKTVLSPKSTNYRTKSSSPLINSSLNDDENDFQENTKNKNAASEPLSKIDTETSSWMENDGNVVEKNNNCTEEELSPKIFPESKTTPNEQRDLSESTNLSIRVADGLCQNGRFNIDDFDKSINHSNYRTPVTSKFFNLPMKKRILRDLLINNSENIDEPIKPIIDYSYRSEHSATKKIFTPIHKMLHLGKKKRRNRTNGKKNASRCYSTASSDVENVSPLSRILREQRTLVREVEVRMDPRVIWEDVTRLHRDYLRAVDFESLKKYR